MKRHVDEVEVLGLLGKIVTADAQVLVLDREKCNKMEITTERERAREKTNRKKGFLFDQYVAGNNNHGNKVNLLTQKWYHKGPFPGSVRCCSTQEEMQTQAAQVSVSSSDAPDLTALPWATLSLTWNTGIPQMTMAEAQRSGTDATKKAASFSFTSATNSPLYLSIYIPLSLLCWLRKPN